MARKIKEEDSDDEIILSSRVKKETSTPKGETLPPCGSFFFFFPFLRGDSKLYCVHSVTVILCCAVSRESK